MSEVQREIVSADRIPTATLADLFHRAYSDYFVPIQMDEARFQAMARTVDMALPASRVVHADGEPAAFACLAIRADQGWVAGMGVVPGHRGRGHGEVAMQAIVDAARHHGLSAVNLEVIDANVHARVIYERLGFVTHRMLGVWTFTPPATNELANAIVPCTHEEAFGRLHAARTTPEPWQFADASVRHILASGADVRAHALADAEGGGAVLVLHAGESATVLQLTTRGGTRAVHALLAKAGEGATSMRWVNVGEDHPADAALRALGANCALRQCEMALPLKA